MISRNQSRTHGNSWSVMEILRRGRARRQRARDRRQNRIGVENLEERMLLSGTKDATSFWVEGEVLVGVSSDTVPADFNALLSSMNLPSSIVSDINVSPMLSNQQDDNVLSVATLPLTDGTTVEQAVTILSSIEGIAFAEPNLIMGYSPEFQPNDADEPHHGIMENYDAWDFAQGDGIVVAVADTGVDWDHVDLQANIWSNPAEANGTDGVDDDGNGYTDDLRGWDFASGDNNPDEENTTHGTHVSGIIAGTANNNAQGEIAGTAFGAEIMPLRIGATPTVATYVEAYAYAADNGAHILNTSMNLDGLVGVAAFEAAVQYVYDNDVLHIASAGNDDIESPARLEFENILFVANTNDIDQVAVNSNTGEGIDLAAPGENINSTVPGNNFEFQSGTSMAAANAAGAAAVIWSSDSNLTRDQVAALLVGSTDFINTQQEIGSGRVNTFSGIRRDIRLPTFESVDEFGSGNDVLLKTLNQITVVTHSVFDPSTVVRGNFDLRSIGPDNVFGTADDGVIAITIDDPYQIGTNELIVSVPELANGRYRFTVTSGGLVDPFGTPLDGDNNGSAGGDYVVEFTLNSELSNVDLLNADFSGFTPFQPSNDGFITDGSLNQWHTTTERGLDAGHSANYSMYFGNENALFGPAYLDDAFGTLTSPIVEMPVILNEAQLTFNHFLDLEFGGIDIYWDNVRILVRNVDNGDETVIDGTNPVGAGFFGDLGGLIGGTLTDTRGVWESISYDISQFAGQRIQVEFEFQSDFVGTGEGWYVDDVRITVPEFITLEFEEPSIQENDGLFATTARVTRPESRINDFETMFITNPDPSELEVPETIEFEPGQLFVEFDVHAVDDTILDGPQSVEISVRANGLADTRSTIIVEDHETLDVEFNSDSIDENAGPDATTLTITRSNDTIAVPVDETILVTQNNTLLQYSSTGTLEQVEVIPYAGDPTPANRLFATIAGTSFIAEIDPATMTQISQINAPRPTGVDDALAFDGDFIWYVSSNDSTLLFKLDPANGDIEGQYQLPDSGPKGGLAFLDGLIYISETGAFEQDILIFSPETERVVGELDYDGSNNLNDALALGTGLAGARNPSRLLVTTVGSENVVEIDPTTAEILDSFSHGLGSTNGLAVLGTSVYVSQTLDISGDNIHVFDRFSGAKTNQFDLGDSGIRSLGGDDALTVQRLDGEIARDLAIVGDGSVAVYDGTDTGFLNVKSVATTQWSGQTLDGLDVQDMLAAGGVAAIGNLVFMADMTTNTASAEEGIVRFDLSGQLPPERFATGIDMIDVTVGWDGFLYGLASDGISVVVLDPATMQQVSNISLVNQVNAIAVNQEGDIFGVNSTGSIYKFDNQTGIFLSELPTASGELIDIDLNGSGELIVGTEGGVVLISNEAFNQLRSFNARGAGPVFVSYNTPVIVGAGALPALEVTLVNNDPSEIGVPDTITIPAGLASVTINVDAIDDAVLDGLQVASVIAQSDGYFDGSDTIDVVDHENVVIDIVDDEVVETDGDAATKIVVSRTNVDGPYTLLQTLTETNETDVTIIDNDVTISQVTVAPQIAEVLDVDVIVNITHEWIGDLDVFLTSPSGTRVQLFTDTGNNGTAFTNTILDDEAPDPLRDGIAPFTGSFQPEVPLSNFDGESISGVWTLEIRDDNARDTGILLDWTLDLDVAGLPELTVDLSSNDLTEATVQSSVTIPANQSEVVIDLNAVDDAILDGTQVVTVEGTADNFIPETDSVDVVDREVLTLIIDPASITEDAGLSAAIATITRSNSDISSELVVSLASDDTSELTVPATVTIPPGQQTTTFFVNAVDDELLDGNVLVNVTASHPDYPDNAEASVEVIDREQVLTLTLSDTEVLETTSFITGTVQRKDAVSLASPLTVTLMISDITELTFDNPLPNADNMMELIIPAGVDRVSFKINVEQDNLLDGDQVVTVSAVANEFSTGTVDVTVLDFETLGLSLSPETFFENAGENASTLTITRPGGSLDALAVNIANSDETELSIQDTVVFPAGVTSVQIPVAAVNDSGFDGDQTVILTVSADGLNPSTISVVVQDHEPPVVVTPSTNGERIPEERPTFSWTEVEGASRYDVWINNLSTGENQVIRDASVLGTSMTPSVPMANGLYRIWVRAFDGSGLGQPWSAAVTFRVTTPPKLTGPVTATSDGNPIVTWTDVEGAAYYDLWVRNLTTGEDQVIREQNVNGTSFEITDSLPPGQYRAWTRAFNEKIESEDRNRDGVISEDEITISFEAGDWSAGLTFDVILTPTIVNLPASTFDHTPTIFWNELEGVSHYDIWIRNQSTGESQFIRDRFVTTNEYTPDIDMPQGDYRVWVRGMNNEFAAGPWSAPRDFSIAGAPVVTSTGDGSNTPVFTWTAVEGTEAYTVWVNKVGGPARVIVEDVILTRYEVPAADALEPGTYLLWIRATSEMGENTPWTDVLEFNVIADAGDQAEFPAVADELIEENVPVESATIVAWAAQTNDEMTAAPEAPATQDLVVVATVNQTPELPPVVPVDVSLPAEESSIDFENADELDSVLTAWSELSFDELADGQTEVTEDNDVAVGESLAAAGILAITPAILRRRKKQR